MIGNVQGRRLYRNGKVFLNGHFMDNRSLLVDGEGRIEAVGGAELYSADTPVLDLAGNLVIPGLIDVHVHGGGGCQLMDGSYEGLNGMSRFHAAHGTTSFLGTTDSASGREILSALQLAHDEEVKGLDGAELLGFHLEGPFLNPIRGGAQDPSHIRAVNLDELRRYIEASGDRIRLVTLAPEMELGMEAVELLSRAGITVSIGHSDATYGQVAEAIHRGASHTTHHFNGMSPFHHREPGVVGAGLMFSDLTTELIADGVHVHPAVVKLLFDIKGADRICMITDAVACAGLPDGDYGHSLMRDGQVWLKDGSSLAGSSLTMLQALRNTVAFTGYTLEQVLPAFTEAPARQSGFPNRKGRLEAGMDADFLIVREDVTLLATYVRGRAVYEKE
ncbi:N-acetylglucosamine-6-phosphate deacetylase [Paenibacillus sp. HJGM_3]|uniref:N-acetylglucosamine-6-phosphate deacetylase n=1 Tax=Paenibacillus sp. HJGM_3 TaxID=3379816 RepID=UPI00385DF5C6